MNIEEQWKNMGEQRDDDLSTMLRMPVIEKLKSIDPLEKIRRNLLINALFGVVICLGYLYILYEFPMWQLIVCIGIVFLFTVWATVKGFLLYAKLSGNVPRNPVLQEMERHNEMIRQWTSQQLRVALLIYPVSAAGGFMLGGFMGSGKSIEVFMSKPIVIIAFFVIIAILVPAAHYLAKWMFRKSFGKYADMLQRNIEALKNEK